MADALDYERRGRVTLIEQLLRHVDGALFTVRNMLGVDPDGEGVPDATETVKGKAELATVAEATAGVDTTRIVTPAGLAAAIVAAIGQDEIRAIVTTGAPSMVVHRNTTGAAIVASFPGAGEIVYITADQPIFTDKAYVYGGVTVFSGSNRRADVRKISTTIVAVYLTDPADATPAVANIQVPILIDILP